MEFKRIFTISYYLFTVFLTIIFVIGSFMVKEIFLERLHKDIISAGLQIEYEISRNSESILSNNTYSVIRNSAYRLKTVKHIHILTHECKKIISTDIYLKDNLPCNVPTLTEIDSKKVTSIRSLDSRFFNNKSRKSFRVRFDLDRQYIDNYLFEQVYWRAIIIFVLLLLIFSTGYFYLLKVLMRPIELMSYALNQQSSKNDGKKFYIKEFNILLDKINGVNLELLSQKERFSLAIEGTKDGLWDWNVVSNKVFFSKNWKSMLDYEERDIGDDLNEWRKRIHPADLNKTLKLIESHLDGQSDYYESEHRMRCKNGNYKLILDRGKAIFNEDGLPLRVVGFHTDITDIRKVEYNLKRYTQMVDRYVITSQTDLNGIITYASESFVNISGFTKDELIGKPHNIVRHPDMNSSIFAQMWSKIQRNEIWQGEVKNRRKDSSFYWVNATISPLFNEENHKIGYIAIRNDISDKKIIEEISITDELTKLYNRRHFNGIFAQELNRAKRDCGNIAYMMIDVDFFKLYNDTYGHHDGDRVLEKVSKVLQHYSRRAGDFAFRIGGEEFGLIFSENSEAQSEEFADAIRKSIEELKISHKGNRASSFVTISVGVVFVSCPKNETVNQLYEIADERLYKAKESGRNRVVSEG